MNYEVWLTYKDHLYNILIDKDYYKLTYEGLCFKVSLERVGRSDPLFYVKHKFSNEIFEVDIDKLNFDNLPNILKNPLENFLEFYLNADKFLLSYNIEALYSLDVEDIEIQKI